MLIGIVVFELAVLFSLPTNQQIVLPSSYPVSYTPVMPVSSPRVVAELQAQIDLTPLSDQLKTILADDLDKYSIYLKDLSTGQILNINEGKIVEPASIAKLPVAVLVMRDIDAGKITLDNTFAFDNSKKFGTDGDLGNLEDGTPITFRRYLEDLIEQSDNNAWYMLVDYLGGSYQVVNPRIINELGINPLFLDPPEGTAEMVGKVLEEIYSASALSRQSADYLISLMENADDWAKAGVGLGLPQGIEYANKIGTLQTDDKVSYQDGAIVWGAKSTYILVVMDEKTEWDDGTVMIQKLSNAVYNYLN